MIKGRVRGVRGASAPCSTGRPAPLRRALLRGGCGRLLARAGGLNTGFAGSRVGGARDLPGWTETGGVLDQGARGAAPKDMSFFNDRLALAFLVGPDCWSTELESFRFLCPAAPCAPHSRGCLVALTSRGIFPLRWRLNGSLRREPSWSEPAQPRPPWHCVARRS